MKKYPSISNELLAVISQWYDEAIKRFFSNGLMAK